MGDVAPVLIATGTRREAATLDRDGLRVVAGGGDGAALESALHAGVAAGAAGIISFGMGGALDPALRLGDWVIGSAVCGAVEGVCDPAWRAALAAALPAARVGVVHAEGALCALAADKARLFAGGAMIVDMESHVAAHVAAQAGLPFAVLRCVSDLAADGLPPAVAVAMGPGGRLAPGAAALSVLRQPGQIPALIRLLAGFNCAYRALRTGAGQVGARLGFDAR